MFSPLLDLAHPFHGEYRLGYQVTIISYWHISPLLKVDGRVLIDV